MRRQQDKRTNGSERPRHIGARRVPIERAPRSADPPFKLVTVSPEYHDVSIAVCAGIFLLGAGQLYNGQAAKGSVLVAMAVLGAALIVVEAHNPAALILALVAGLILYTAAIIDAGVIAGRLIRCEPVRPWQWF